jgi:hypothetical protein
VNTGLSNLDVYALALSPGYTTDGTIFAGTVFGGGVFKSTNGGASWNAVNTGLDNVTVYALGLSPGYVTDHTLFAGAGGRGVFKSTDGGASWSTASIGLTNLTVYALALSPDYVTDHTLFAGTVSGVFKSTDGGASWDFSGLPNLYVQVLALSPNYASDRTLFAGTGGWASAGVFESSDGGASWNAMNTGLSNLSIMALALTATSPRILFAGTEGSSVWRYGPPLQWLYLPVILNRSTALCDLYEPNDDRYTNPWGPLQSAQTYQAKLCTGDAEDNYYFDAGTTNPVQLRLQLPGSLVGNTAIWLYALSNLQNPRCGGWVNTSEYTTTCSIPEPGRYIIRLYTDGVADDVNPYTLQATFQ